MSLCGRPHAPPGLPGPSTRLSSRALPNHPEQPGACMCSLLPHRWQASAPSEEWPLLLVSRGRIGFACAGLATSLITTVLCRAPGCIARPDRSVSRSRLPFHAGPELHAERAIHMADTSQSARRIRVSLVHRRTRNKEARPIKHSLRAVVPSCLRVSPKGRSVTSPFPRRSSSSRSRPLIAALSRCTPCAR
jgi:hypothetical protein